MMNSVQFQKVTKSIGGRDVLTNASFEVAPGEFVVIVGPSGCGKTTILRLIAGLESVDSGRLWINGRDVTELKPSKRKVAMVFQSYALYPHMTVYDNIAFSLYREDKNSVRRKVLSACKMLELDRLTERLPKELSGGQRQRVAIARSLVRDPDVFLMDEPLSNLDVTLRTQTRYRLAKLKKKLQAGVVYVTHDQLEAMTLADRIIVMREGSIEQIGAPFEVYHHPQTKFVASFIGRIQMNFLPCSVSQKDRLLCIGENEGGCKINDFDMTHVQKDGRGILGLRPECAKVSLKPLAGFRHLTGAVSMIEDWGGEFLIHVNLDPEIFGPKMKCCVLERDDIVRWQVGSNVCINFKDNAVHLFDKSGKVILDRQMQEGTK